MVLIQGLPNDIARQCLIRVSFEDFPAMTSVCKRWKDEVLSPEFLRLRKMSGCSQLVVAMLQSDRTLTTCKLYDDPTYGLSLGVTKNGKLCELPASNSWSKSTRISGVGSDLVFIREKGEQSSMSVYTYNFLLGKRGHGTDMSGNPRYEFKCASDLKRWIYVFGGSDMDKKVLNTMLAYDVMNDVWISLPDMTSKPGLCRYYAEIKDDKTRVISYIKSDLTIEWTVETFNIAEWQWDHDLLQVYTIARTGSSKRRALFFQCVGDTKLLILNDRWVSFENADKWEAIAKLPKDFVKISLATSWQQKMLVIGFCEEGSDELWAYVLDLLTSTWEKVKVGDNIIDPHSFYCLEI